MSMGKRRIAFAMNLRTTRIVAGRSLAVDRSIRTLALEGSEASLAFGTRMAARRALKQTPLANLRFANYFATNPRVNQFHPGSICVTCFMAAFTRRIMLSPTGR